MESRIILEPDSNKFEQCHRCNRETYYIDLLWGNGVSGLRQACDSEVSQGDN